MLTQIKTFLRDEEGATAVEYGLIIGLIAVLLIVALTALGGSSETTGLRGLFNRAADAVAPASTR
jgi:pilus assembly protein Flp/PilA